MSYTPGHEIKLVAMDVDGVLTDGKITYSSTGAEHKSFNVKDGLGITLLHRAGLQTALITARSSIPVERRAAELDITHVMQGQKNKLAGLEALVEKTGIPLSQMAYIGDDLPDLPALEAAGLSACPQDAVDAVKAVVDWRLAKDGGSGAIREFVDRLLSSKPGL